MKKYIGLFFSFIGGIIAFILFALVLDYIDPDTTAAELEECLLANNNLNSRLVEYVLAEQEGEVQVVYRDKECPAQEESTPTAVELQERISVMGSFIQKTANNIAETMIDPNYSSSIYVLSYAAEKDQLTAKKESYVWGHLLCTSLLRPLVNTKTISNYGDTCGLISEQMEKWSN